MWMSQACLRIRHLHDEFNTMFTEMEPVLPTKLIDYLDSVQICVSHPETFHIYIQCVWPYGALSPWWHYLILFVASGEEIKEHSAFPKPAA